MRHLLGNIGTYKLDFGSICESRGLSNLTPSRSRLFKLIGKARYDVELQQATSIYGGNILAKESEKRRKKHGRTDMIKK